MIPYSPLSGVGTFPTRRPVFLSIAKRCGWLSLVRPVAKSSVGGAIIAAWPLRPGSGTLSPLSSGWFVVLAGASPLGIVHRRSPVLRSIATIRPYGPFQIDKPSIVDVARPPRPPPATVQSTMVLPVG